MCDIAMGAAPAIAVSDAFRLAPWADILYSCDAAWWLHPKNVDALKFGGTKVTLDDSLALPQVKLLRNSGTEGFDPNPECLRTGNNSGYQALEIPVHAGARKILLCGFDMHGTHFFGEHPDGLRNTDPTVFQRAFIPQFEKLAPILAGMGVDVVNCNPNSALKCFRFGNLEDELP
jgi:hypothetical protein